MKTTVEDLSGSQKKLAFEVPPEEVTKEVDKYCRKLAKEVDIKGFRKGKAPPSVIKRYFRQQIFGEIASEIISSGLEKALKENDLTPLGEPAIDAPGLEDGKEFLFSITLDVKPQVPLEDYAGIEVEEPPVEVEEGEVAQSLEELRKAHGELKPLEEDREVREGDVVLADYQGVVDGEPLPDTSKEDAYIEVGSGGFKQEIEEALVGARMGETRQAEIEYPPNFVREDLAGRKIPFHVTVKKIMVKELPEFDDEFAKDVGPYETLDALKERLLEQIRQEKEHRRRQNLEEKLLDELIARNPFEAPRSLVESRKGEMLSEARHHFLSRGMNLEESREDREKLEAEFGVLAEKQVKKHLLLEAIADKESLRISDADLDAEIRRLAEKHSQSYEKVKADIEKREDGLEQFRQGLLMQKTLDFLLPPDTIKEG